MITMTFIRTWFRWLLSTAAVLLADWVLIQPWLWRVAIAVITVLLFTVITGILYSDWKRSRQLGGYRYSMIQDISRD